MLPYEIEVCLEKKYEIPMWIIYKDPSSDDFLNPIHSIFHSC